MRLIKGWSDWHVHPLTYLYFIGAWLVGYLKEYSLLLMIVTFHELGHYLVAKYYHFEIKRVLILPFGAFIQLEDYGFHLIKEELFVVLGGLCMHLFLFLVPDTNFQLFQRTILLFNLLPIYPLDGSKIVLLVFSYFFDFRQAILFQIYISLLSLSIFVVCFFETSYFIVFMYLFYQIVIYYFTYPMYIKRLLLQRVNTLPVLKEKIVTNNNFYRAYHNYYQKNNRFISEENYMAVLLKKYSK